eukprot:Seg3703.1 transcript_id=Seg3703.1/GoldUCD/mRNA.D3Y31 product="hypothetical protein" protein_id=Seg3703.1/GoldUCD/D3Y31
MEEVVLSEGDVPGSHFTRDPEEYSVLELKRWLECHGGKKSGRKQELVPGSHFTRDPEEYSVLELKRWLECHGGKKSGRKQELVDRIRSFIAIKKGIDPKVDGGKWYEQKRQERGLLSSSQPRNIETPEQGWGTFPTTDIPMMFNYGHVYQYLIESVAKFGQTGLLSQHASSDSEDDRDFPNDSSGYTSTARPLRKGMNLMKSGFVKDMLDHTDDNYYFCKGHVHHSIKMSYHLQLRLSSAIKVEYSSKTNEVSRWELSLTMKYEDYTLEEERKTILKTLVNDLEESLKDVFTGTGGQVEYTEIPGTKEQSASLRWFEERRYRITASKCKTAYSCGEKLLCERGKECLGQLYNWIRNKFWFPKHITTKDIEYGIETEATARDAYKAVTGNCISESGIWVCNRFPYLGASPDVH